jgi:hypothetical protein
MGACQRESYAVVIRPEDDKFHDRSQSPFWNESSVFMFMIPERRMSGFVYVYHRPNLKLSAGGAALWDPSGEEIYDCLHYEFDQHQALADGAEMFDCALRSGLRCESIELLKSYRLVLKGTKGYEFDLTWDSIMEPHELRPLERGKVNPGVVGFGSGHYEQGGRMRGVLSLHGETLEVNSWSMRDHTWGPRTREGALRGGWSWAIASEKSSFQFFAMSALPPDENPIVGTTERVVGGWYMKDGVLGDLVAGERRVVERGEDGRPRREVIDATDSLGRTLHAEGRSENCLKWTAFVEWFDWWSLCNWEFDGQEAWGEAHDYLTFRQVSRFLATLRNRK